MNRLVILFVFISILSCTQEPTPNELDAELINKMSEVIENQQHKIDSLQDEYDNCHAQATIMAEVIAE